MQLPNSPLRRLNPMYLPAVRGCIWLSLVCLATHVEGMVVVATLGPTEPAKSFYQDLHADTPEQGLNPSMPGQMEALAPGLALSLFPVSTPELSVGAISAQTPGRVRQALANLNQPIFVVGSDEQSLQWLSRHRETLARIGAVGLAVEVSDAQAWERLRSVAPELMMSPVSGSSLASELGLTHYPVLVTDKGFQQ